MTSYRRSAVAVKWLLGFSIVGYLLTTLEISEVKAAISETDLRYLAGGLLVIVAIRILLAWQTTLAIQHQRVPLTISRALVINTISAFYALFLPGDLISGVVRWHKLSKPSGKRAEVFAAIFFLRLINTTFILVFGIVGVLLDNRFSSAILSWTLLGLLGACAAVYICIFTERIGFRMEVFFKHLPPWMPRFILEGLRKVWASLTQYSTMSKGRLLKILLVPPVDLVLNILLFLSIARSLNLWIPIFTLVWIRSMVFIIGLIPASISGLGLREGALVFLLPYYGVNPGIAMVFSLIIFGFTVLIGLIGGILEAREALFSRDERSFSSKGLSPK